MVTATLGFPHMGILGRFGKPDASHVLIGGSDPASRLRQLFTILYISFYIPYGHLREVSVWANMSSPLCWRYCSWQAGRRPRATFGTTRSTRPRRRWSGRSIMTTGSRSTAGPPSTKRRTSPCRKASRPRSTRNEPERSSGSMWSRLKTSGGLSRSGARGTRSAWIKGERRSGAVSARKG